MGLRDIELALPPGYRFCPSDEELVCHYLYKKVNNESISELATMLLEVDLHTQEPWQLPEEARLSANEWYFFSFRDRKYATGVRSNRATKSGYWKATGKDRIICEPATEAAVGMRKTLVFYHGRAPNGTKTNWVMHEFRLENPNMPPKEDWVLCRVFHKGKGETLSSSTDRDDDSYKVIGNIGSTCTFSPYAAAPSIPLEVMCYDNTNYCMQQQQKNVIVHSEYHLPKFPQQQRHQSVEDIIESTAAMDGENVGGNDDYVIINNDNNSGLGLPLPSMNNYNGQIREGFTESQLECSTMTSPDGNVMDLGAAFFL